MVAKVNDQEITVHQLNFALSKVGKIDQAQLKPASEKVLRQLVDLELLAQKSLDSKLDRDPNVLQVLEATKQQVLAQAYLQKIAGQQTAPSENEIGQFYQAHPELFSERKVYVIREFLVKNGVAQANDIRAAIEPLKTAEDIAAKLKEQGFAFNSSSSKRSAEQLPAEVALKFSQMREKDVLLANNQADLGLFFIENVTKEPVELDKAKPYIQQYLANTKQQSLVKDEMTKLRAAAKVSFFGEFKELKLGETQTNASKAPQAAASATSATPPATTSVAPTAATAAEKTAEKPVDNPAEKNASSAIEKGLSGL